jgi:hypothetical protein
MMLEPSKNYNLKPSKMKQYPSHKTSNIHQKYFYTFTLKIIRLAPLFLPQYPWQNA